ncbi:hypothetical protein EDD17DRAFT_1517279 [Pisolithus thermaeus]|nr:hypothetical protein EDD17DRAFT_1517279 [Pisolithus thermaeus]
MTKSVGDHFLIWSFSVDCPTAMPISAQRLALYPPPSSLSHRPPPSKHSMSPPNANTTPTMPNNTSQALAILRQVAASAGGSSPRGQELLARLTGIEVHHHWLSHLFLSLTSPLGRPPCCHCHSSSTDTPATTVGATATPTVDLPAVDMLVPKAPPLSATPPPTSPLSSHIPTALPTHAQPEPEVDELDNAPHTLTPTSNATPPLIPSESPLSGQWQTFLPDWHLEYISQSLTAGGWSMYPIKACKNCLDVKAICSRVEGVKCAHCKARHSTCSFYEDTPASHACAKMFISWKVPTEDPTPASSTSVAIKPDPEASSSQVLRVKKVRVEFSPTPSSSHHHDSSLTTPIPSASPIPPFNFRLAIRDMLHAAANAFSKSLEEQRGSGKALETLLCGFLPSHRYPKLQQLHLYIHSILTR